MSHVWAEFHTPKAWMASKSLSIIGTRWGKVATRRIRHELTFIRRIMVWQSAEHDAWETELVVACRMCSDWRRRRIGRTSRRWEAPMEAAWGAAWRRSRQRPMKAVWDAA